MPPAPRQASQPSTAADEQPVRRTSLAEQRTDDATVRFNKWTSFQNTAYQKGQFAGFPLPVARRLVSEGLCVMVTK